jgi:hypothetical protein
MDEPPRLSSADEQKLRALVKELNALVPRVENQVRMIDVDDEVEVVATRAGALRLGVAILRAAVEERDPYSKRTDAEAELHALIDPDGDTWIGSVVIERDLPALKPPEGKAAPERRGGALGSVGCFLLMIAAAIVFFVGFMTSLEWVVEYLATR